MVFTCLLRGMLSRILRVRLVTVRVASQNRQSLISAQRLPKPREIWRRSSSRRLQGCEGSVEERHLMVIGREAASARGLARRTQATPSLVQSGRGAGGLSGPVAELKP
ncbi:unnamed protein product [Symbiodinium necroappetens]|uniref:Uncharacterized protein n=1 Tax=Symbiodinium necroappetens TaxID=1628268 RepID=A0A812QAQ2_9DINO|nr:unnamed protein product [Symbiodinium necroappetens]